MTNSSSRKIDRPACQAADPSRCSECTMAYDCNHARSGRAYSWGVVALAIIAALVLLSRAATGV